MKKNFLGLQRLLPTCKVCRLSRTELLSAWHRRLAQIFLREVKRRTPVGSKPEFEAVTVKSENGRRRKLLTAAAANAAEHWRGYQGGTLRRAWIIRGVRRVGGVWTATIFNPMEYASYVENGHRQKPGRFVPALGVTLKKSWVEGRFMMRLSAEYVEKEGAEYVQQEFEKYLRGHWYG